VEKPRATPAPVATEVTPERHETAPDPAPPIAPIAPPPVRSRDRDETMLAMFQALGFALSARFILFAALVGGFVLAVMAMVDPSAMRLGVLVAYSVLCVIPMVALEFIRRNTP